MPFIDTLRKHWRQFVCRMTAQDQRTHILEGLRALYHAETHDAAQFAAHASRMYYPHFRDRLLHIAAEERRHAQWLRTQIQALGGDVAPPRENPNIGENSWECLSLDVEEEKRSCEQLAGQAQMLLPVSPEIAEGLLRIRAEEQRHHEELWDMWMKSDPYTPPVPKTPHPDSEQRKQAWISRHKGEWMEQQRAEWQAAGKPGAWAAWVGELEKRWLVNELPRLELLWARQRAEEEITTDAQTVMTSSTVN